MSKKYTINKLRFLDWYFFSGEDSEQETLKIDLANKVVDSLYNNDPMVTVEDIFKDCNQDAIRLSYLNEFAIEGVHKELNREYYDIELSELGEYKLELLD